MYMPQLKTKIMKIILIMNRWVNSKNSVKSKTINTSIFEQVVCLSGLSVQGQKVCLIAVQFL